MKDAVKRVRVLTSVPLISFSLAINPSRLLSDLQCIESSPDSLCLIVVFCLIDVSI